MTCATMKQINRVTISTLEGMVMRMKIGRGTAGREKKAAGLETTNF